MDNGVHKVQKRMNKIVSSAFDLATQILQISKISDILQGVIT